jgi:hypothetical protein
VVCSHHNKRVAQLSIPLLLQLMLQQ